MSRNVFKVLGKPKTLKGKLVGLRSKRIEDANRLVYKIFDDEIEIIECKGHYGD